MSASTTTKRRSLFPQDKVRGRLMRRLYREFLAGVLSEAEYRAEVEALDDYLADDE